MSEADRETVESAANAAWTAMVSMTDPVVGKYYLPWDEEAELLRDDWRVLVRHSMTVEPRDPESMAGALWSFNRETSLKQVPRIAYLLPQWNAVGDGDRARWLKVASVIIEETAADGPHQPPQG